MKDERIEQAKNKIRSEISVIVLIGIMISFLVKRLVFDMDFEDCVTEYVIIIFYPLYQFIRMHMMKISVYSGPGNKRSIRNLTITIVILLVASTAIILSKMNDPDYVWQNSIAGISTFLVLFIVIFFVANKYNQYRGHKYENKYDDDK